MTPAHAANQLAKQMRLDGSTRLPSGAIKRLSGEERVQHENATTEERAALATARLQRADADIAAKKKLAEARGFAAQEFIHSPKLAESVNRAKRCITVDDLSLRAELRAAWDAGFSAGYIAGQKNAD